MVAGMNRILTLFILLLAPIVNANEIILAPGRFLDVDTHPGESITVANGSIIRVSDRGRRIRVVAKKRGSTELRIGSREIPVHVVNSDLAALHSQLSRALEGKRGLNLTYDGKALWIRGRLLRWEDWADLGRAAQSMSPRAAYQFAAELEPEMRIKALEAFKTKLRAASIPEVALEVQGSASALIPASPADLKKRVQDVLAPYGFNVEGSPGALSLEPMVRVRIIVAEVDRQKALQYGVKWPDSVNAQLLPNTQLTKELAVDLQALETSSAGRVLASPTLLCRSGKEAKFIAGGEFPIKIVSVKRNDVIWKQYGVVLIIRPLADASGRMSIALETEVSDIGGPSVDGIPGIKTNRIESHFDLTGPRTIALSGLLRNVVTESSSGLPVLGQVPILGPLFSSKNFQERKTELVVFVTPEIAKPGEEES